MSIQVTDEKEELIYPKLPSLIFLRQRFNFRKLQTKLCPIVIINSQ